MYYKNIKDYDQLRSQRKKGSSDNGSMLTVVTLTVVIGLVTAILM